MDRDAAPAALVHCLADTVESLQAATRHLTPAQLIAPAAQDGWSPNEILWHIRATADVYGEHIDRIVNEDSPRWRHVSPRARMKKARYDQLPFAQSFAAFAQQRSDLVAVLASLPPEAWERVAIVRVGDRESRVTLQERAWGMATHEEIHCAQMKAVAAVLSPPG